MVNVEVLSLYLLYDLLLEGFITVGAILDATYCTLEIGTVNCIKFLHIHRIESLTLPEGNQLRATLIEIRFRRGALVAQCADLVVRDMILSGKLLFS